MRINSGGGDVFAANAIYTRLKDHPAKITVKIDGWAASAATIIAMAGDVIEIPANGIFMVHEAQMGLIGYYGKGDFAKLSEEITVINNSIVNGYALKTGKPPEEIAAIMSNTTWYDGKQAVEAGFCDRLMFEDAQTTLENASKIIVNHVPLDLTRFPDLPISLLNRLALPTPDSFSNTETQKECNNMEIKTIADLKAAYPDLTAQLVQEATAAERQRIQDIENVALAGFESIVNDAKFTNPKTAGDVARAIVAEQKQQGASYLLSREPMYKTVVWDKLGWIFRWKVCQEIRDRMKSMPPLTSCSRKQNKEATTMYEIQKDQYTPDNFIAGDYPIVKESFLVRSGETVRKFAPVTLTDGEISEATATLENLCGIALADASGDQVVCYLTGEFFADALTLPDGVTIENLKPAFCKLGIFLK